VDAAHVPISLATAEEKALAIHLARLAEVIDQVSAFPPFRACFASTSPLAPFPPFLALPASASPRARLFRLARLHVYARRASFPRPRRLCTRLPGFCLAVPPGPRRVAFARTRARVHGWTDGRKAAGSGAHETPPSHET
jgi:hypothetical protein